MVNILVFAGQEAKPKILFRYLDNKKEKIFSKKF